MPDDSTEHRRYKLRIMASYSRGICRPEKLGEDVAYLEELERDGYVLRIPHPHVPIFQITDKGRDEAKAGV